jgi:hypothetical protein
VRFAGGATLQIPSLKGAGSGNVACVCVNETKVSANSEKIVLDVVAIVSRSDERRRVLAD